MRDPEPCRMKHTQQQTELIKENEENEELEEEEEKHICSSFVEAPPTTITLSVKLLPCSSSINAEYSISLHEDQHQSIRKK
ncbi:hypothetical protein QQF64_023812 [Cirrhinus molitorella]|uniref:Uncharacterized protein n=1 Tax=Cirrhinus molitorella TaxID=172907 RepID=A0ABR3NJI7_9TELE